MPRQQTIVLAADRTGLVIHLLGGLRVAIGSRVVAEREWRLRKTKSLVKLLALAPSHELHREQVMDLLWPDLAPEAAAHNLHQTLYTARRSLHSQSGKASPYLLLHDDIISLAPQTSLWIDVDAFESAAEQAHRLKQVSAYQAALDLYGGDLLPEDRYEDWVSRRRDALREAYLRLLIELADLSALQKQYETGIEMLRRALESDPACEEAHRDLMRLYVLSGHRQQALRQYQLLREALQREVEAEPDAESTRLYQDILDGRFASEPVREPLVTVPSTEPALTLVTKRRVTRLSTELPEQTPNNLPIQFASFVGRAQEKNEVKRRLGLTRLLTLVGSGGCGKTRLALQVASELLAENAFTDGVWLVELAALSEPSLVPQAVASILGVSEQSGYPLTETLKAHLKPLRLLLVLDNCEHLIGACADLAETLLRTCPNLRILATSREPLHILGELTWRVPSLSLPDLRREFVLEELMQCDAVSLFVERASAVLSTFALTAHNAPAVARICTRLDGIPLAIELAAARVSALSVEQIASRIADAFRLLTGGSRTALPRQQTLQALMDWSYALLSEQERMVWRRLAVFAGGFNLEAAEFVCGGMSESSPAHSHTPTLDVLDLLTQLVNKSLVLADQDSGRVRYRLLETVRLYAQDKLLEVLEATLVRQRHRRYYLRLAEQAELELLGPRQSLWLARLETEYDNLLAALVWSQQVLDANEPSDDVGHADALVRLCGALWSFWYARGSVSEGRQWLAEALAQRDAIRDSSRAALVKVLAGAGVLAWAQGDYAHAQTYCQESLELARALDIGSAMVVASLTVLGTMAQDRGDLAQAHALFEQSLQLMRAAGHQFGIALALDLVANAARHQGNYARATELFTESLAVQREIGDQWGAALSLHNLGQVALDLGNPTEARVFNEEALALFRNVGSLWGMAICLYMLGEVAQQQSDYARALSLFAESLALFQKMEDRLGTARLLHSIAQVQMALGDQARALALHRESLSMRQALGDQYGMVASLEVLAVIAATDGQRERAARLFGAAESLRRTLPSIALPITRADPAHAIADARASLQDDSLASAWAEGRALSMEQAVAYALESV